jgi:peptidoglycan/xylan/chitin deacetylase (PgdA/CDA1 family)
MDFARLFALSLYYHGTTPYRWWRNRRDAGAGRAPVIVLFYHRVADDRETEWTCTNRTFARQMRWLAARFDMVSLAEAQQRIRREKNHRPSVSITFDDGYAENCRQALPLLIRERIPCTYFVATQYVLHGQPFPHDVALGKRYSPNSIDQLRQLAAAGIEIGAHTRSHADLGKINDPTRLCDEVVVAGEELQAAIGRPVRYFAFPYGQHANLNPAVFQMAYDAGYEAVCSAYGGFNFPGDDAFHLQRIHGDADMIRLKNWATVDPRKKRTRRYAYESLERTGSLAGATVT